MVKRRFNNLRTEIANNARSIPPKKSLYDLRERAKQIIETAKKTPEEQPIISKKHDLRVKLGLRTILSSAIFKKKYIIFRLDSQMNSKNRMLEVKIQIYSKKFFRKFLEQIETSRVDHQIPRS
jgi:hypothetical protein